MEFLDVVAKRRMVRRYRPDPVPREVVLRVLDTARRMPSAGFSQPVNFIVVTSQERRTAIAEVCGEPEAVARGLPRWLSVAPVHVFVCIDHQTYHDRYRETDKATSRGPTGWDVPWPYVDGGQALGCLFLAATDAGLGAGLLDVDESTLRTVVDIPAELTPLGLVTLGYPFTDDRRRAVGSAKRGWKPISDLITEIC